VKTASGATAVQIVHKRGRVVQGIEHIGSAHDADQLALLEQVARERLHAAQHVLQFDPPTVDRAGAGTAVVEATSARLLWEALNGIYEALGLSVLRDEAFRALVLARIVEPVSKLDTVRVLDELGVSSPSLSTFMRCLKRVEGNKAETKTLVPVLNEFRDTHPATGEIIVVADAGMLSAANLLALEEAGFRFIVGSKISKAPYDLANHLERHGNAFDDGQIIETTRTMGTGKTARPRRVVYQWRFARYHHDIQAINAMIERAEAVAAGKRPLKRDRFVKVVDADPVVDWDLVERARYAAGLKGYVTNISPEVFDGERVVAAYHDLYQVERSFRTAKSDLAARPIFHRLRDSIEAHLTVVFTALAVSREAQARTGVSINKIVKTLRPLRTATITLADQQIQVPPHVPDDAQRLLDDLRGGH
jgi:hypothetical protein